MADTQVAEAALQSSHLASIPMPQDAASALNVPDMRRAIGPTATKAVSFYTRLSESITDPLFVLLRDFKWADRQQHGRQFYNKMMQHMAVAGPMRTIVDILKSYRVHFKPAGTDPTPEQIEYADFLNEQLRRMGGDGDPRQGYEKFVEWIGQGLRYGFTIAEMGTSTLGWRGQARVQLTRIKPIPQATLDSGYNPMEEFSGGYFPSLDVRYNCFKLDDDGTILSVHQFPNQGDRQVVWTGAECLNLLIHTHAGGEGNPYGESLLFPAAGHFADLYAIEQMDKAMLDGGQPFLGFSYKTPDGRPSPALHAQVLEILKQQDKNVRAFVMPDTTYTSVSPSNPTFNDQSTANKKELRSYIHQAIFGSNLAGDAASATEIDTRQVLQVVFKYLIPALQREIATILQWQLGKRLIDANWSNVPSTDYPQPVFSNTLDNELRVSMPIIQQILPFVDSARLGEMLQALVPGFDENWIPESHKQSVVENRAMPDPAAQTKTQPTKPEGSPDVKQDTGRTIGEEVGT